MALSFVDLPKFTDKIALLLYNKKKAGRNAGLSKK